MNTYNLQERELLVKDLFDRLKNGFKVNEIWFEVIDEDGDSHGITTFKNHEVLPEEIHHVIDDPNCKPILFPLSSLKSEIQIANYNEGKPFVPSQALGWIFIKRWPPNFGFQDRVRNALFELAIFRH